MPHTKCLNIAGTYESKGTWGYMGGLKVLTCTDINKLYIVLENVSTDTLTSSYNKLVSISLTDTNP
jgi:hypothetical protein